MAEGGNLLESSFEEYEDVVPELSFSRCVSCNEPAHLYCNKEQCRVTICDRCFMGKHSNHDVVDIRDDKKNKHDALISGLSDLSRELYQSKAKIVMSKDEVDSQFRGTVKTLKAAKLQTIRKLTNKFNKMIKYASQKKTKTSRAMEEEILNFDQILTAVDSLAEEVVEDSSIPYEDIMVKLRAVKVSLDHVKKYLSGDRSYQFLEYHGNLMTSQDVDRLCGSFSRNEVRVEFRRENTPLDVSEVAAVEETKQVSTKPKRKRKRTTRKTKASPFTYKGKILNIASEI